ncbi:BON domain-containing protein [Tunturiibacter gelidoferens]|uniref:Osmotically-inducible protein OsmY n=1 Tax=Tunturiibacter gelidiferens TaxID=3069689 RepID=A0ACC5NTM5_9BACT|nr:BON domain-containing protein [Edaphobacter lichenicola]MBB5337874.1 osmotically-inducible protein OsmY [Edaphobacter lichenicola]
MKPLSRISPATAAMALLCAFAPVSLASAQQTAPDNSQQNKNQSQNADNQSNSTADRMTTAKIRKAIIADKTLSMYAHNVKIITLDGQVTLKGPVKSEEEKQQVASDVSALISADKLTNQLTVKQ